MNKVSFQMMGGLGNMLFSASAALAYAKKYGCQLCAFYNHTGYLHTHPKEYRSIIFKETPEIDNLGSFRVYNEPFFEYSRIPFHAADVFLHGYFQSEKYFKDYTEDVRKFIKPCSHELFECHVLFNNIVKPNEKVVSLHVRRGNYLDLKDFHHNICLEYYRYALTEIPHEKVLVFSDDLDYCKENFRGEKFIFCYSESDLDDMYLMSMCDHHIIANSSFSWWGAWLNDSDEKIVIAPRKWFGEKNAHINTKDLIPSGWRVI